MPGIQASGAESGVLHTTYHVDVIYQPAILTINTRDRLQVILNPVRSNQKVAEATLIDHRARSEVEKVFGILELAARL